MKNNNKHNGFRYGEDFLTIGMALKLARNDIKGVLTPETISRVKANRDVVLKIVHKKKVV